MQFVKHGPNVPDKLLQAHEEGRVVFFCGAGISFPAKLPGFGGLVNNLYKAMGVIPNAVQKQALDAGQFDTAVSLLEGVRPTNEWRLDVRTKLAEQLTPDLSSPKASQTHQALLELSKTPDNKTRLITTNFDRIFQKVINDNGYNVKTYEAPLLPVPKNRWDGLVYLHGLLPESCDRNQLDQLVISSGDFGLAYLYERWAARFISELFRTYTVCFVGYSLNDPVLRYMMDALAADRLLGESPPEMYAFGSYQKGKEEQEKEQWLAKNVTPILYKMHSNHYYLHQTLLRWSELYRDGLGGKEQIVVTHALTNPTAQDIQFDYVKQLVWSLSDPSGLPAKRFANLEPSPTLDWLFAIDGVEMEEQDLSRFGIVNDGFPNKYKFNLFQRPSKSSSAPSMNLAHHVSNEPRWDKVMDYMALWLSNHLNSPDLVLYLLKSGGNISSQFSGVVENAIQKQVSKREQNDDEYFSQLKRKSPNAVLSNDMITVWNMVLSGYCSRIGWQHNLYSWIDKYKHSGLSAPLRKELRSMLSPTVRFEKPLFFKELNESNDLKKLFQWDIELSTEGVRSSISELNELTTWADDCRLMIEDFSLLLEETMFVMNELGDVNEKHDYIFITHPSIEKHPQNRGYSDWTILIDLCRDAWTSLHRHNTVLAETTALNWWKKPFPIFKRLAMFAATKTENISTNIVIEWLSEDSSHWLWETSVQRETCQLLKVIPLKLSELQFDQLLKMIIAGPNRDLYLENLTDEEFSKIYDQSVWLLLSKVKQSGRKLTKNAEELCNRIEGANPHLSLSGDEKEEFSIWMSNDSELNYAPIATTPETLEGLTSWLKTSSETQADDWLERCRTDFDITSTALIALSNENLWPIERWRDAINSWSQDGQLTVKAWQTLNDLLIDIPANTFQELSWSIAKWLSNLVRIKKVSQNTLFLYYEKIISLSFDSDSYSSQLDPLTAAINHPVGIVTESVFNWWYSTKPMDDGGLESRFQALLTETLSGNETTLNHAKTIIFTNALSLYRVDTEWAKIKVLPFFKWESKYAAVAWKAFLWSPRIHKSFLANVKQDLLDCALNYNKLGEVSEQYARFLTYVAIQQHDEFKVTELAKAFNYLPSDALLHVASSLNETLLSSGEKIEEYWSHRVKLFILRIWPKETALNEQTIHKLVLVCIAANEFFEDAFSVLKHYISRTTYNDYVVKKLYETSLLKKFPYSGLHLLDLLIGEPVYRPARKLESCLQQISVSEPSLVSTTEYKRLRELISIYSL
ncbi:hypothetical protein VH1709_contig00008-0270 [Vibrio harveyi]|uniref:anti-phage defense-associated sirtuin Dsr1 n=1 Tax=Vibrio harveyi TaxID=669 RepID=UPI000D7834C5|nr:anti-phage defense-associated sirtuin Dsr1 [Vibrio harveyi]GBK97425.1 hypothetical protein VH1709_contig00008-0270 [Vibrio harveyi]